MKKNLAIGLSLLFLMPIIAIGILMGFNAFQHKELPVITTVPEFSFTERTGQPYGSQQLKNKVWVGSFIFTSCSAQCPLIVSELQKIQKALRFKDNFRILSFTLDPLTDTPERLSAYANQAKAEMEGQAKALQAEGQALQQQIAILAPDVKQKKIDEYQKKEAALQGMAQRREAQIQGGVMAAQQQVEGVMGPILQSIMQQRGANMILDKSAVVFANSSAFDITQAAIDQLNQKMSTVKVTLQNPPTGGPAPAPAKTPSRARTLV